jgi:REP element-mobilizing transposase RayT
MLRKGSHSPHEFFGSQHRFEHWYRDNSIYFITARCRHRTAAFATPACKDIFWDRFNHYVAVFGFVPIIVSLLDNHYHLLGYLREGKNLGPMMQKLHGSVAKLVNDARGCRLTPFWVDHGHQNYFDGCIRDERQFRRAYRYTLTQCRRHGITDDPKEYPHTHIYLDMDRALKRALELRAFLENVPYKRYQRRPKQS